MDEHYHSAEVAEYMPDNRNVWSDGSCVTDDLLKFQSLVVFSVRNLAWPGVLAVVGAFGDVQVGGEVGGEWSRLFLQCPGTPPICPKS